ncbi:unnamed protein product, partial [Cyprideis torosa]
ESQQYGSWGGIRDALYFGHPCPQVDILTGTHIGDEDCLFLNVYVPGNVKLGYRNAGGPPAYSLAQWRRSDGEEDTLQSESQLVSVSDGSAAIRRVDDSEGLVSQHASESGRREALNSSSPHRQRGKGSVFFPQGNSQQDLYTSATDQSGFLHFNGTKYDNHRILRRSPPSPGGGKLLLGLGGSTAAGSFFSRSRLFPVLVFIHGGHFVTGSASQYGPESLMREDIILVTFNYRLGVLGWFTTESREAPGNWGLSDMVTALRWVKTHIGAFGGDPDRITLMGQGAGAAAAHMLMMSPRAKGLFDKVILQSGTALCSWASEPHTFRYYIEIGERIGCYDPDDEDDLRDCLEVVPVSRILDAQRRVQRYGIFPLRATPVVDRHNRDDPFLPDKPSRLLRDGRYTRVPMISGVNQDDGLMFYLMVYIFDRNEIDRPSRVRERVLRRLIRYLLKDNEERDVDRLADLARRIYFAQTDFGDQDMLLRSFNRMFTDFMFASCHAETVRLQAQNGDTSVYSYVFTYRGKYSYTFGDRYIGEAAIKGLSSDLFRTVNSYHMAFGQGRCPVPLLDDIEKFMCPLKGLLLVKPSVRLYQSTQTGSWEQVESIAVECDEGMSYFGPGLYVDFVLPHSKNPLQDNLMSLKLSWLWSNFAHTGHPIARGRPFIGHFKPYWTPADQFGRGYYNLSIVDIPMMEDYRNTEAALWNRELGYLYDLMEKVDLYYVYLIVGWTFVGLCFLLLILLAVLLFCCLRARKKSNLQMDSRGRQLVSSLQASPARMRRRYSGSYTGEAPVDVYGRDEVDNGDSRRSSSFYFLLFLCALIWFTFYRPDYESHEVSTQDPVIKNFWMQGVMADISGPDGFAGEHLPDEASEDDANIKPEEEGMEAKADSPQQGAVALTIGKDGNEGAPEQKKEEAAAKAGQKKEVATDTKPNSAFMPLRSAGGIPPEKNLAEILWKHFQERRQTQEPAELSDWEFMPDEE